MAMNVKSETYRDEDGTYAVTVNVTFEPKAGTYRVQFIVNETETEVAYFTDRKTALIYANTGLSDLWFNPITPVPLIAEEPAIPDMLSLDDDEQPTEQDVYAWMLEAKADAVEHGACLSHIPARCGCGDCLTYLAGEQ